MLALLVQDGPLGGPEVDFIVISQPIVSLIVGVVLPLLVGFATKFTLPGWIKGVLLLVGSTLSGMLTTATVDDGSAVISMPTLWSTVLTFLTALGMYFGIYRDAGLTSSQADGKLTPTRGLGPDSATVVNETRVKP